MNTYVRIDPAVFDGAFEPQTKKGITLEVAMSPYDIPTDISGEYSTQKEKFLIAFSYPGGTEKTRQEKVSAHVTAHKGISSDRIYRLELDVDELGVQQVRLITKPQLQERLTEAIEALNASPRDTHGYLPIDRARVNARILREVRDHYLESVTK